MRRIFSLCAVGILLLTACAPVVATPLSPSVTPSEIVLSSPTVIVPTETPPALWISPAVPEKLRVVTGLEAIPVVEEKSKANIWLNVTDSQLAGSQSTWVYALVAAFPTLRDGASFEELKTAWSGNMYPLLMTEATSGAMKVLFGGEAGPRVKIVAAEGLTEALWQDRAAWGIVPFEQLDPKTKVLTLDGQSPIHKDFEVQKYRLVLNFALVGSDVELPPTNRDPEKLVTLVMTGVTALVRATAFQMENKGINYPAEGIRDWLTGADIAHISNEIPFAEGCPFPNPDQRRLIFCSDPKYITLLDYVGADVIELTGNHFEDWGKEATRFTVDLYRQRNLPYFGGGVDLADAQKPAILERGGMKFAFIGCNPAGPVFAWAREDGWPGAAPCGEDWSGAGKNGTGYEWMVAEIQRLKSEGYIVIATFQYFEYYSSDPRPWQMEDFRQMAEAGATVVSGSQGHYAQAMEFYNGAFIHYGLGNLFFDQMGYDNPSSGKRTENTRREFLDRYVFYDGKLISTELLTAMLYDYAQPRPMTPEEREAFLKEYFEASGWGQ